MKKFNLKAMILTVMIVAFAVMSAGCTSKDNNDEPELGLPKKEEVILSDSDNKNPETKKTEESPEKESFRANLYEENLGKTFSQIEENFGELSYAYYLNGGEYYSAKDTSAVFAFSAYDINSESPCTALNIPLKELVPALEEEADSNGFVTADQISSYFDSTYTYRYDEFMDECYKGTAYKEGITTDETYMFLFYTESDGSCSVDSVVMVKVDNR